MKNYRHLNSRHQGGKGPAGRCAGQTLLEFTIALAMMLSIVFALLVFLGAFSEYGWRILTLVGLKYP